MQRIGPERLTGPWFGPLLSADLAKIPTSYREARHVYVAIHFTKDFLDQGFIILPGLYYLIN